MPDTADFITPALAAVLTGAYNKKGLTLVALAERTGISVSSLGRYFNGKSHLTSPVFLKIVEAIGDRPAVDLYSEALRDAAKMAAEAERVSGGRGHNPVIPLRNRSVDDLESSGDARAAMSRDPESDEPEDQAP
ncbi:helix-turn-helix transcriptional regulator [Curtobacterium sp. SORGH_AS_0776]|uniref:helix-turn-helix domain-containing protein n=1 Tax=Curtobacterium sp. SORGH_AS_0776 TaxID=3041798 RepID=UPI00286A15BB|nr:helix-turn-helix transcriptional regulator [Curtobacterium sp. SORGH_AS_0776]